MVQHDRIVIETGTKKVFASALDWPGWCRSGRTEEEALATLFAYADRYRLVADLAGARGVLTVARAPTIAERLTGNGTTDFGAPDRPAALEREPLTEAECDRQIRLLTACWERFDAVAASVSPALRKGPRGGGRDRDGIVAHTLEAERNYVRRLGVRTAPGTMDSEDGLRQHRDAVCRAIRGMNDSGEDPRGWPLRYAIRRAAWHVMDHAWEMEDKDLS